ncbi:DUF3710 domain-containing protein [Pseudonocardia spinosispora]|uniref:DUF3710 domain-containing protein n=1 Tax=Pseudonocardia spinosispora TaxID=103441 RepID=UPI0003FD7EE9|nr:DUF3710 domain-containing protein [Pseudonocardia spinosispora]
MSERAQEELELDESPSMVPVRPSLGLSGADAGPYDSEDPDAPDEEGALDFGSLRIPMPTRAQLQVEKGTGELLRAVHVLVPSGRVSLSALAAPRTSPLWRELAEEIATSLSADGARVRSEWGEWGREVQAGSNGALSRFIGVDGPRWMLYGVATGPAEGAAELASTLREMICGTVVVRGVDPLPVKTVLPLKLPEHLEERVDEARRHSAERSDEDAFVPLAPEPAADDDWDADEWHGASRQAPPAAREQMRPREPMSPREPAADSRRQDQGYQPAAAAYEQFGQPAATSSAPRTAPEWSSDQVSRSIGIRRSELRPVTPPGQRPGGRPNALPPVPAITEWDTAGIPRLSVESTWTMATPVVSADAVEHQPAWARLTDAPSFWPDPYPARGPAVPGPPDRGAVDDTRRPPPPAAPPYQPPPAPRPPLRSDPLAPDPWSVSSDDRAPEPSEPEPSDSLHNWLTNDASLSQDRLPRVPRRGRHRRPD